ncbi:hypothetical protein F4141_00115 [Candidatus Poribacteria bacterium]|nr:hypothetical protein [Candidatus Poribacteria bacterium]MYH79104.1 hypothetical protein [Candidatus Poribacteria bacterium]
MKYTEFKKFLFALQTVIVVLLTGFALPCIAEKEAAIFSGGVVDTDGNPVAGLPVFIAPAEIEGEWIDTLFFPDEYSEMRRADTDADGQFSITNIPQGSVYFGILPYNIDKRLPNDFEEIVDNWVSRDWRKITQADIDAFVAKGFGMRHSDFEPDVEILSLRVQGTTFYSRTDFDPMVFGVEPGADIKNAQITVQSRMRIRARVVFTNGTPLTNAHVRFRYSADNVDGRGHRQSGGNIRTDTAGYFVYYLDEKDDTARYTFSIEYQELSAEAAPVELEPGARLDGLTFTFDSEPIPPKAASQKAETDEPDPPSTPDASPKSISHEPWIVNPTNGHAYKRVSCESREDAVAQAAKEKAYLVAINDAKEQAWLTAVFGQECHWIGLSNVEEAWQWNNGEPVIYENWLPDDFFSESIDAIEREHAIMTFTDGKWYAVGPKSILLRMTAMAILEKSDVLDNPSAAERQ